MTKHRHVDLRLGALDRIRRKSRVRNPRKRARTHAFLLTPRG